MRLSVSRYNIANSTHDRSAKLTGFQLFLNSILRNIIASITKQINLILLRMSIGSALRSALNSIILCPRVRSQQRATHG
jgi:hypothetical protein